MDIVKKNIHMGRVRARAACQVSYDDDMNIPDQKPDVSSILLQKGEVMIEEIKAGNDAVNLKGKLCYEVLYATNEPGCSLVALEGHLPFEEKMILQGATMADQVQVDALTEDLTIGMINSRKLSVQALITFNAQIEELYDEALPIDVSGDEQVEYRRAPVAMADGHLDSGSPGRSGLAVAQLCMQKKDIFRIKEECALPSNYPNVSQILSYRVKPMDMEFKLQEDNLEISGDLQLCVIYEGEGEGHPVRAYETTIAFNGKQECAGVRESMIPDILYSVGQKEVVIKPDRDGEERCIALEICLDMDIRVYEELEEEIITDIYGVRKEVVTQSHKGCLQGLLGRIAGKMKLVDHVKLSGNGGILQILYCDSESTMPTQTIQKDGVVVKGLLLLNVICITGNDEAPFASTRLQLPYRYMLDIPGIGEEDQVRVNVQVEQLQTSLLDGDEADVKAVLSFQAVAFRRMEPEIIDSISIKEQNSKAIKALPGFAIYRVKPGDNLWSIGKRYHVSVDSIRHLNGLTQDELMPGQKLLIMKEQKK